MKRVLVVDDDAHIRRLARFILAHAGFEVVLAADGQSALEQIDEAGPDVVVLDLNMPVMDGREVSSRLNSRAERPYILVVTAGQAELVKREVGADASLGKPFLPEELVEKVRELSGVAA